MEHTEDMRLKLYFIGNNYKRQLASSQSQAFQSQLVIEKASGTVLQRRALPHTKKLPYSPQVGLINNVS